MLPSTDCPDSEGFKGLQSSDSVIERYTETCRLRQRKHYWTGCWLQGCAEKVPLDAVKSGARPGRASELRGCVVPNTTEKYFLLGTCLKLCSQILNTKRNLCMESRYLEPRFEPLTRPGSPQPNSLERLDDYQKVARSQPWQR